MQKKKKNDILTRAISTVMFTNSVFFLCFFKLCIFAENTIKIVVSAKTKKNKTQQKKPKKPKGPVFNTRKGKHWTSF